MLGVRSANGGQDRSQAGGWPHPPPGRRVHQLLVPQRTGGPKGRGMTTLTQLQGQSVLWGSHLVPTHTKEGAGFFSALRTWLLPKSPIFLISGPVPGSGHRFPRVKQPGI